MAEEARSSAICRSECTESDQWSAAGGASKAPRKEPAGRTRTGKEPAGKRLRPATQRKGRRSLLVASHHCSVSIAATRYPAATRVRIGASLSSLLSAQDEYYRRLTRHGKPRMNSLPQVDFTGHVRAPRMQVFETMKKVQATLQQPGFGSSRGRRWQHQARQP
jgi:hypothetical protein